MGCAMISLLLMHLVGKNINLYMSMYMVETSIRRNFPQIQLMIQNNSQSVTKQAWEKENLPN